jgi:Trypsin-co-occurring domain 1
LEPEVLVETVRLDSSGSRQIGSKSRTTALLRDRRAEIEAAVREASTIVQNSADAPSKDGWGVTKLEAKFGLTLAAEAGVVLSRASAEASFEITITIQRAAGSDSG